jgi:hypothetical protein
MNRGLSVLGTIGLGAGLMFFLDPQRGRRRRSLVRDKVMHTFREAEDVLGKSVRDLNNRTTGLVAEARHLLRTEVISEETLAARIRSRLGHLVAHPRAIEIEVDKGHVVLTGHILIDEVEDALAGISSVRGVTGVENRLSVHTLPDIPGLQGRNKGSDEHYIRMQKQWPPGTRLLAGVAGGAMALYGSRRRSALGLTLGSLGIGILTRVITNQEIRELIAPQSGPGERSADDDRTAGRSNGSASAGARRKTA